MNKSLLEFYLKRPLRDLFKKLTSWREIMKWRVFAFIVSNKSKDVKTHCLKIQKKLREISKRYSRFNLKFQTQNMNFSKCWLMSKLMLLIIHWEKAYINWAWISCSTYYFPCSISIVRGVLIYIFIFIILFQKIYYL